VQHPVKKKGDQTFLWAAFIRSLSGCLKRPYKK
jgi:hypothetical protein